MGRAIPITRTAVEPERALAIREAIRTVSPPSTRGGVSSIAVPDDAAALTAFLSDARVHAPIYTLPRPLTDEAVKDFIADHQRQRERGDGLLWINRDGEGQISGYSDLQVWPEWASGELGGALHPKLQSKGAGAAGARATFQWMFEALGLERICATAAPNNTRTARLLDGLGFQRMGEVESLRPDGSHRRSLVWEIDRRAWGSDHA